MLSSMSKLQAVEMLTRVTDKALQIHGGIGFWQPNAIERVYRDARAQRFEEGTNEIQKTVIARELLEARRMSRRFEGKIVADHRQLARNRSRPGAHARARRRRVVVNYQRNARSGRDDRRARSNRWAGARIAVQANVEEHRRHRPALRPRRSGVRRLDHFVSNAAASSFKKIADLKAHNLDRSFDSTSARSSSVRSARSS